MPPPPADGAGPAAATPLRAARWWRAALVLTVLVQVVALYAPRAPGTGGASGVDKIVHCALFAAVAFTAVRAGLPWRPVVAVLLAHAVASELVQHFLLPDRSGDPLDAVADSFGTGVGVLAGRAGVRRARRRDRAAARRGAEVAASPGRSTMEP